MARTQIGDRASGSVVRAPRTRGMRADPATILGLTAGFGLVFVATTLGGSPESFLNLPSFLIVFGGTLGVTMICFSVGDVLRTQRVILKVLIEATADLTGTARQLIQLADQSRRDGVLALQDRIRHFAGDRFAIRAFEMVVDGAPADEIDRLLRHDIERMQARHQAGAAVLRKAAEVAPAMGLIGTLIGLVQMLGNLDDPSNIGPSMAVALITTFYGAILSTMLFGPLASKLDHNSQREALHRNVIALAAVSIARRENPRRLELLINAMLPPENQLEYFN